MATAQTSSSSEDLDRRVRMMEKSPQEPGRGAAWCDQSISHVFGIGGVHNRNIVT
jgi:hypothetical protein